MATPTKKDFNLQFGNFVSFLGILILVITASLLSYQQVYAFLNPSKNQIIQISNTNIPVNIQIPNAKINLNIIEGGYRAGQWILDDQKPLYFPNGVSLGQPGNLIIYGHNTYPVFGKLANAKTNQLITLTDQSNQIYTYKITSIETVLATNTNILTPSQDQKLTIFTCSGPFDSLRLVITAYKI